jgi:DNA-directed RNA polymerase specialized sigma24 family protein
MRQLSNRALKRAEASAPELGLTNQSFATGDAARGSPHGWLLRSIPDWSHVWATSASRIHRWRVPPHWSPRDWREEIDAESLAAACHAVRVFDPTRGMCLSNFAYHQILAKAMARYRTEWSFALRIGRVWAGIDPPEASMTTPPDLETQERLLASVTGLTMTDRQLLERLFWDGQSEEAVAKELGITKQAINKRKWKILLGLRRSIEK